MEIFSSYNVIIEAAIVVILSFWFNSIAKKTNIPAVLMLITLGILIKIGLGFLIPTIPDFTSSLEILGTVGLIMIVLEASLELELKREKLVPILKSMAIALIGLVGSAYAAALILHQFIPGMDMQKALIYATPLSILSSAIIIPSVGGLSEEKKEFHVYESTFSDIMGIMMFYFLIGGINPSEDSGFTGFTINLALTILIAIIASYAIILIFQRIKSQAKLFLLISVLLLLYAIGKKLHLSSLLIILIFGLMVKNIHLFFPGKTKVFLEEAKMKQIYHELHIITLETAFVVRTFFFVIFGITIVLSSLLSITVMLTSLAIIASIYLIRFAILRIFMGTDIQPQLYIAPRGLITVLLFYAIPNQAKVPDFESGILLFVIIATSLIMTWAMIKDKRKMGTLLDEIDEEYAERNRAEDLLRNASHGIANSIEEQGTPKKMDVDNELEDDAP